jgi:hypothetical protein
VKSVVSFAVVKVEEKIRKYKKQQEQMTTKMTNAGNQRTLPGVIDRATLLLVETFDMTTTQSMQCVSADVALELPNPIYEYT